MSDQRRFAVVILAAGQGTRMRSDTHKVLHPIAGRRCCCTCSIDVDAMGAEQARRRRRQRPRAGRGRACRAATSRSQCKPSRRAPAMPSSRPKRRWPVSTAVLILYGDTPFVTEADDLKRMLDRLDGGGRSRRRRARRLARRSARAMDGSSWATATTSPRWSNIRTRPRRSARSTCAIQA